MSDLANITKYRVARGWVLIGEEDSQTSRLPIASVQVAYVLDQLPTAQVVPASGIALSGRQWLSISDLSKGDRARIYLEVNNTRHLLLDGYISTISTTDESSPTSRRMGASISIQHRAVKLAGAPSVSFVYANNSESLFWLSYKKANVNIFKPSETRSQVGIVSYIAAFLAENFKLGNWPSEVLRKITLQLFETTQDESLQEVAASVVRSYEGAQTTSINMEPTTFLRNIGEKYADTWRNRNAWEALVQTARYLMLHVVPFNDGFYIADPYSLDREPSVVISPGSYLRLQKTRNERLSEPVNGVVLRAPAGVPASSIDVVTTNYLRDAYVFPPVDGEIQGYYHYRSFPSWLYKERAFTSARVKKGKELPDKPEIDLDQDKNLKAFYDRVGRLVARAIFGQMRIDQTEISINFPFRTDLMPGTVFKLANVEDSEISFIGDSLYGMVTATTIRCSTMSGSPDLSTQIRAVSIRNETDNEQDQYTFEGHPIYDERWPGIDLNGAFLTE